MTLPKPLLNVQLTEVFRQALIADGLDPDGFAAYFACWRADWPKHEFTDFYFGKDGGYRKPTRDGKRVLRHVHMAPADTSPAMARWKASWKHRKRKTSDEVLVYTYDPAHGYLLLHLAKEPTGHALSDMDTNATRDLMNDLADVAEAFIFDGTVLI